MQTGIEIHKAESRSLHTLTGIEFGEPRVVVCSKGKVGEADDNSQPTANEDDIDVDVAFKRDQSGSPRTRFAIMLSCTSLLPPAIERAFPPSHDRVIS